MRNSILLSLALLSFAAIQSRAETRLVPGGYATIQQAIQECNDGDVVVVEPGTYLETINFLGKNIVVTSTDPDDPDIVAGTVINGNNQGSVVTFENGETSEAVLTGFTISGGLGTVNPIFGDQVVWGAGIYCAGASPTITKNVISNNNVPIRIVGQSLIEYYGGGIACIDSDALITHNIIKDNAVFAGAGVFAYPPGHPTISNNLIYNNSAYIGGGVILLNAGRLINNTIVGNDSSNDIEGQTA